MVTPGASLSPSSPCSARPRGAGGRSVPPLSLVAGGRGQWGGGGVASHEYASAAAAEAPVSHGRGRSVRPVGTATPHPRPRPAPDMRLPWGRG